MIIDHPVQLYQFGVGIMWSGCRGTQLGCDWLNSLQHGTKLQTDGALLCNAIFLLFAREKLPVKTQVYYRVTADIIDVTTSLSLG